MPGNELGDRVHNFFAQENASQGQHHSPGNWPVQSNNFWVGGQRQIEVPNSNSKNYNLQNSDVNRGPDSYSHHVVHGLNFPQPNLRPEFAKSLSLNEQTNLNGYMYGNHFHQASQNEANFPSANRDSDQRHLIMPRGSSGHELQQGSASDHRAKASGGPETSGSFDLFNGQQQMSHLQSSMLQSLQHQQSGISDMQQFQQQYIRKMQELQMQQQLQLLDVRQQNIINQVPHFAKQASGGQSSQANNTLNFNTLHYPWASEVGANWLNRGSPAIQGSANGFVYSPNLGQSQQVLGLGPQQVDQSLYGVPVSSSKGLSVNEHIHAVRDRSSVPQTPISTHTLQGNHHNLLSAHVGALEGSSRQNIQNEDMWRLASSQSGNSHIRNIGGLKQVNTMSKNAPPQDFLGRQESAVRTEALPGKTAQVSASQNEVALDPTEEKILFGSDDNIWAAFGGEAGNSFEHEELSNGLPSIQGHSWSALMQSAVAETSSNDAVPQEDWSSLVFNSNAGSSTHQPPSVYNDIDKLEVSFVDNNSRMAQSPSDDVNANNVMGLNQFRHKFQNEPGQKMQFDMSQQSVKSMGEASKWSNSSQPYHPLETEKNAKTISTPWTPAENRTRQQPNVWNAVIPGGRDRVQNNNENLSQNSQSNQLRVMQGEVFRRNSLKKSNSNPGSVELVPGDSTGRNTQANKGILTLNDASSVSIPSNVGVGDETSSFLHNNFVLNNWKNASILAKSQAGESLGNTLNKVNESSHVLDSLNGHNEEAARHEMHNRYKRENSSDSHHSNLSQHTFGSFGEIGLSNASDSQALPSLKQKSSDQVTRKESVPLKFQYHPMGNLDEHVEPAHDLNQPTNAQHVPQRNFPFVQSNLFGQAPRNSTFMGKGQSFQLQNESKVSDEEQSCGSVPGYAPNISIPTSQAFNTYASNRVSSTSQNMLELLHKVDQSMDHSAMMEFSSSELPESEKFDGAGRLNRSQSGVSQGFGLQLGPPSQRPQNSDHLLSSKNAEGTFISLRSNHSAAQTVDNSMQIVPTSSFQSLHFTGEEIQTESKIASANPGHSGNEKSLYKIPGHFPSAFSSGNLYASNHLHSQQTARVSGQLLMHRQSDSSIGNASCSERSGSGECVIPNASASTREDNHASHGGMSQQDTPNAVQERVPGVTMRSGDHIQTPQHFTVPGISRQRESSQQSQTMWTNVPTNLHTSGAEFNNGSTHFQESLQPHIVESSSGLYTQGYINSHGSVDGHELSLKEISGHPGIVISGEPDPKMKESLGKSSSIKNCSGDSSSNSASTLNDIETFGRCLKPNSLSHDSYSLLNQMQALKDAETDANNRVSKRIKGSDNLFDVHQVALKADHHDEYNIVVGDSRGTGAGAASDGSGMLKPTGILQRNTSQPGNLPTQDVPVIGHCVSQSNSSSDYMASDRVYHPQISPQMAPSWFNQYGTFNNGQVWPIYDTHKLATLRAGEPLVTHVKASCSLDTFNLEDKAPASHLDACQVDNSRQNSIPSTMAKGDLSFQSSQLNVTSQHMITLRPKKRSATSELHPWHKDVSEGAQNFWSLSIAERDWSKATNCLIEKEEDDAELIDDKHVLRSRRRLKLTTQLMQQLFCPAPAAVLSADATSDCESVAYAVSRVVLGDACSTVSRSTDLRASRDDIDVLPAKAKLSDKNNERHTAKNVEEFMERAKKLDNDFLRLDKSVSVLDSKAESQELEKFSVINRLARFHARWQADSAEAATADVAAATQKPVPQRYVTAFPIPRSLPDCVQCLSL